MDNSLSGSLKSSVRSLPPLESGGAVARNGMGFQDHVAAGFCIRMLSDEKLREVWCERQDDITLIWADPAVPGGERVEFVQVKSNQTFDRWTVARLCSRSDGKSILDRLLDNDRASQPASFRMVTAVPVEPVLQVLTREASAAYAASDTRKDEIEALQSKLADLAKDYRSPNGHDCRFWVEHAKWDFVGPTDAVHNANVRALGKELGSASHEELEDLYKKLLDKVWQAACADWRVKEKRILRDELMTWMKGEDPRIKADLHEYFRRLRDETGLLSVRGLKVETGRAHSLPIQDFYIPLSTRSMRASSESVHDGGEAVPLEEGLKKPRLLIQGEAGSGKSTFLKRIAWELASRRLLGGADTNPGKPLSLPDQLQGSVVVFPIFIRIADLEQHVNQCMERREANGAPTIRDHSGWLAHFLHRTQGLPESYFLARLREANTLVMLDGLDEAPTEDRRRQICVVIEKAAREFQRARFAITTRPGSSVLPDGFYYWCSVDPLSPEATNIFLDSWNRLLFDGKDTAEARKHRAGLAHALAAKSEIRKMALNPLMLTALAVLYWNDKQLPEQRAELYESILAWLATARDRETEGSRVSADECLDRLGCLAFGMQCAKGGRMTAVEKGGAAEFLQALVPRKKEAIAFLEREEVDSGIIVSASAEIRYAHLTFQEFLAARELAGFSDEDQFRTILNGERLYQMEWREVIRLWAGLLLVKQGKRKVDGLIARILREAGDGLANHAKCVALLSAIAKDLAPRKYRIVDDAYDQMKASIYSLFEDVAENDRIDLPTRVAAAEALGEEHPKLRLPADEEYWVPLPHAGFSMGRFPVTVWEFGRFVAETGNEPRKWEEQQAHPRRPAVHVDWNQARAYCDWLSRRSAGAAVVRLPTSEEWELAAAGTEGREYPWGSKPEPNPRLANYDVTRIVAPTPVGLFPKGNTPEGLCDMAGNVSEWTASEDVYGKIARGGSFGDYAKLLRCSFRINLDQRDNGYDFLGFRVIRE